MSKNPPLSGRVFVLGWLIAVATMFGIYAADAPGGQPNAGDASLSPSTNAPFRYIRLVETDSGTISLQIAIRKFQPRQSPGPVIWLTAVSHVGDPDYYRAVQRHLDSQGMVLFEGIKPPGVDSLPGNTGERAKEPASSPAVKAGEGYSLQASLAKSLGLAFQLESIDYARPNFQNSDLNILEIQKLLIEGAGKPRGGGGEGEGGTRAGSEQAQNNFKELMELMQGGSWGAVALNAGIKLVTASPKLRAMARMMFMNMLSELNGDPAAMGGIPDDLRETFHVLIQSRNKRVIEDAKKAMKVLPRPKSMAIFYGAAHMEDMERRLSDDMHYEAGETEWLTAMSVRIQENGITRDDVELARSWTRWQMESIKKP